MGATVYDKQLDGSHPRCHNCGKPMDHFGWHALGNCNTGYSRKERDNKSSGALKRQGMNLAGIPPRREEIGLILGGRLPARRYLRFNEVRLLQRNLIFRGLLLYCALVHPGGRSNSLLIRRCSTPGAASYDAKERNTADFTRREL